MSAGDQAFIRAYAKEAKTAYRGDARAESTLPQQPPQSSDSIPAPHGAFTAAATSPPTHTSPQGSNPSMPQGSNAPVMQESIAPAPQVEISPVQMPGSTLPTSQWRIDARDASGPSANLPLSAYSLPTPVEPEFRPSYEVDRFIWPATCDKMLASAGESFDQLADMLIDVARRRDCKVIAVTGCRRNEGRSLMMLTLGKVLAHRRVHAVLVDGDFQKGQLARQLGLSVRVGYDDALAGELELIDVMIDSLQDGLALLPLHEPLYDGVELRDKLQMTVSLGILRDHYDLVLIDAGPVDKLDTPRVHCFTPGTGIDGAILTRDTRNVTIEEIAQAERQLTERGIACLGVAENFVRT